MTASHPNSDLLLHADHAEGIGDRSTAVSKLRAYLSLHPDEGGVRLRLGRLLMELAEPSSARGVLLSLDHSDNQDWCSRANRLLAALDEQEGALTSARVRWERVLADDIDDPEAHAHLRAFGPRPDRDHWPATLSMGTLASPDGVHLSRFKLIREVGRGASAAVYLVQDERLNLPLALKVLHPQLAAVTRTEAREKFFAEARLASRLRHPGVAAIYGVDEAARCLAMEYVAGGTVRDRLRTENRAAEVDEQELLNTARSLLGALAYVHGAGVVHGDLKPGNVLLRRPGEIVLGDFGAAALATDARDAEGRSGGTPLYLAPEQFRGAPPSIHTDLFSAGAILFELRHGRPARRHSDLLSGDYAIPDLMAADTDAGNPPAPLAPLIAALMSTAPSARPPSAQAALALIDP